MSESVQLIFDWAPSHTRRSDAVEIRVDTLAQIRLSTTFESSLVSVKGGQKIRALDQNLNGGHREKFRSKALIV